MNIPYRPSVAVAALRGGSGKTIVSLGLIRALSKQGLSIAPFKKGPDYIDPAWLSLAANLTCFNLDSFLMNEEMILSSFVNRNPHSDIALIEGNRGLFDGYDVEGTHSFAELVKLLNVPLVLVVECTKSSRSVAAIVHGCNTFDENLSLSGVILNRIAGERHKDLIKSAIEKYCRVPVIGILPRIPSLTLHERHLGLVPVYEHENPGKLIDQLGDVVTDNVNLDEIVRLAAPGSRVPMREEVLQKITVKPFAAITNSQSSARHAADHVLNDDPDQDAPGAPTAGIIRDQAFNFYYPENIEHLSRSGIRIVELDSLYGAPGVGIDALYIGGGFPETHADRLSKNTDFRLWLKDLIEDGLPVYAECGGLVYLSRSLKVGDMKYPMVGIFSLDFEVAKAPEGHGYTIFEVSADNPYFPAGTVARGHEFRYSKIVNIDEAAGLDYVFKMQRGRGIIKGRDGILYKNALATFSHTHASGINIRWIDSLADMARKRTHLRVTRQPAGDFTSEISYRR